VTCAQREVQGGWSGDGGHRKQCNDLRCFLLLPAFLRLCGCPYGWDGWSARCCNRNPGICIFGYQPAWGTAHRSEEVMRRDIPRLAAGIICRLPGASRRDRPPGRTPGTGASGRGGAQRRRLDPVRPNSAMHRPAETLLPHNESARHSSCLTLVIQSRSIRWPKVPVVRLLCWGDQVER
jgi:hypothetical protein